MAKKKSSEALSSKPGAPLSGSPMDVALLEQIVKLMAKNDLTAIELQDGEKKVMLQRGGAPMPSGQQMYFAPPAQTQRPASASSSGSGSADAPSAPVDADAGLVPIKSPMVGTFYTASGPDAKPFVSVGSAVDEDTDVCIIEAMKVFNNIKPDAGIKGTIAKILVTNGQAVEFGQPLFLVKS